MTDVKYVMVCMGLAGFHRSGQTEAPIGQMLVSYDPEAHHGEGEAVWTHDLNEARLFDTTREAALLWQTVPKSKTLRADGKKNRPLMAYTIEITGIEVPNG